MFMPVRCALSTEPANRHRLAGELGDGPEAHVVAGAQRLENLAVTDVDGDMVRRGCAWMGEEDEVARLLIRSPVVPLKCFGVWESGG